MAASPGERRPERLLGVDAARGVALLGMMAVHVLSTVSADGDTSLPHVIAGGRSAALFAVLAGVGLALASGGARPPRGRRWGRLAAATAARAVVIAAVGFAVGPRESGVAVILVYYGVLFLLATPFLRFGPAVLLSLAGLWAVGAPVVSQALRESLPRASYDNPVVGDLAEPGRLATELLLTGYYPAFTWLAYLLAGLGLGRLALRSTKVALVVGLSGALAAAAAWLISSALLDGGGLAHIEAAGVGDHPIAGPLAEGIQTTGLYGTTPTTTWWWLAVASPHSGTPFDFVHTIGTALVVLGVMLLLARAARAAVWPLAAVGSMTLTLYTLHVVLLSTIVPRDLDHAYLIHVVFAVAIAVPWRALVGRGPLEAVAALAARLAGGREQRPAVEPPGRRRETMAE